MIINTILILGILAIIALFVYRYIHNLNTDYELDDIEERPQFMNLDINYLVKKTTEAFSKTLRSNMEEDNLSKEELMKKKKSIGELRTALNEAAYGNEKSKRIVKNYIKDYLSSKDIQLNKENVNEVINFNNENKLKSLDKFELLLHFYEKKYNNKGFENLMDEHQLNKPKRDENGLERYVVTEEDISNVYHKVFIDQNSNLGDLEITFEDKQEIITQRVFEKYIGFGAADMLLGTTIDELDAGVSGIPKGGFSMKSQLSNMKFSFQSIWIVYKGLNIHMECIGFDSQNELIRVTENIYRYDAPYVMSKEKGYIVSYMIDGSRIVAARPPFAESYSFFARKFDSSPSKRPADIIKDENNALAISMMKWLIKGQRNVAITGSQGTGKSTMLKSMIRFIDPSLTLRIQELQFELNLRFTYPNTNIETFQETPSISAQEGLNLQKKTNGSVNIIGEVATAIQASHLIQTAMVASLFAMFTHHAKTAADLVEAISNNLLELGQYKDKKDATRMASKVLQIDMHLSNIKGNRHIERITEIVPIEDMPYPSDNENCQFENDAQATMADLREYMRRMTNPKLYETRDLIRWINNGNDKDGHFELVNLPSTNMIFDIKTKLSAEEEELFNRDLQMMKKITDGERTEEIIEWEKQALAC